VDTLPLTTASILRILLVDSDVSYLNMMQSYIAPYGHQVDIESNSSLAIKRLENAHYQVVVGDLLMAPLEPLPLFHEIRAHPNGNVNGVSLLLIGPEEPTVDEFVLLYNLRAGYISKYRGVKVLVERIHTLVQSKEGFLE
jgi:DNA-binding response OmpR family regulator